MMTALTNHPRADPDTDIALTTHEVKLTIVIFRASQLKRDYKASPYKYSCIHVYMNREQQQFQRHIT